MATFRETLAILAFDDREDTRARAHATLTRLPIGRTAGTAATVASAAIFGKPAATRLTFPLNAKTTAHAVTELPAAWLEPSRADIPVAGLAAYIEKPRRGVPDVVHVVMRDGRERYVIQEGHTRLGAATLKGVPLPVRVWEFEENATGGFDPVPRGLHGRGLGYRDKLTALSNPVVLLDKDEHGYGSYPRGSFEHGANSEREAQLIRDRFSDNPHQLPVARLNEPVKPGVKSENPKQCGIGGVCTQTALDEYQKHGGDLYVGYAVDKDKYETAIEKHDSTLWVGPNWQGDVRTNPEHAAKFYALQPTPHAWTVRDGQIIDRAYGSKEAAASVYLGFKVPKEVADTVTDPDDLANWRRVQGKAKDLTYRDKLTALSNPVGVNQWGGPENWGKGGAPVAARPYRLERITTRALGRASGKTKLTKPEQGRLGEALAAEYLATRGGDVFAANTEEPNFPVDLVTGDHVVEVKAGSAANTSGAQQWRLTIGEPGPSEKAALAKMSERQKARWNANKEAQILVRKEIAMRRVSEAVGHELKPKTLTLIVDPDRRVADVFEFDGFHPRIGWTSGQAQKGYRGTFKYSAKTAKQATSDLTTKPIHAGERWALRADVPWRFHAPPGLMPADAVAEVAAEIERQGQAYEQALLKAVLSARHDLTYREKLAALALSNPTGINQWGGPDDWGRGKRDDGGRPLKKDGKSFKVENLAEQPTEDWDHAWIADQGTQAKVGRSVLGKGEKILDVGQAMFSGIEGDVVMQVGAEDLGTYEAVRISAFTPTQLPPSERDPSARAQKDQTVVVRDFRKLETGELVVDHSFFHVPDDAQGHGLAKTVLADSVAEYQRLGVAQVETEANLDVGGYAWAKFGFMATDPDVLSEDLTAKVSSLKLAPEHEQAVRKILKDGSANAKLPWVVAGMRIGERKIGKELLLGSSWDGVLDLKDKESMDRFHSYVGKK